MNRVKSVRYGHTRALCRGHMPEQVCSLILWRRRRRERARGRETEKETERERERLREKQRQRDRRNRGNKVLS